jgi:polyisoprenyl-phosphate glycosyltransferase
MPVYGDAAAAAAVIADIGPALNGIADVSVVLVDDGSNPRISASDLEHGGALSVSILTLRRNLGHQRAIAIGLSYVVAHLHPDAILVMDADGQDRVVDMPKLLHLWSDVGRDRVVFAARARRSESVLFRVLYNVYRGLHRVLTGVPVRFGNFSVVPFALASRLVVSSELWNHYAAAVLRTRLPYTSLPTTRGHRVHGESRMNFVALVVHGLSALSVFSDTLGVRLLVFSICGFLALLLGSGLALAGYTLGLFAVPQWGIALGAGSLLVSMQVVIGCALLAFVVLSRRTGSDFIPARDYGLFLENVVQRNGGAR